MHGLDRTAMKLNYNSTDGPPCLGAFRLSKLLTFGVVSSCVPQASKVWIQNKMDESKHEIHSQVDAITAGTASVVNLTAGQLHCCYSADCVRVCLLPRLYCNSLGIKFQCQFQWHWVTLCMYICAQPLCDSLEACKECLIKAAKVLRRALGFTSTF